MRAPNGFSLLELLVAVSILALSIIPILASQTSTIRNTARLQERILAQIMAENLLAEYMAGGAIKMVGTRKQGALDFQWQGTVRVQESGLTVVAFEVARPDAQALAKMHGLLKADAP